MKRTITKAEKDAIRDEYKKVIGVDPVPGLRASDMQHHITMEKLKRQGR